MNSYCKNTKFNVARKWLAIGLILIMSVLVFPANQSWAATGVERPDVKITSIEVKNDAKQDVDKLMFWENFFLKITWDASNYGTDLKAGDYFEINFPDTFWFPPGDPAKNFDVLSPTGELVATAKVTDNGRVGGGKVRITFTDYVVGRKDVKGTIWLSSLFNQTKIKFNQVNAFNMTVGTTPYTFEILVDRIVEDHSNVLFIKWATIQEENGDVPWHLLINIKKENINNVLLTDQLSAKDGDLQGITYVEGSFFLDEVEYNQNGDVTRVISTTDISNMVTLTTDKTGFSYNIGDVGTKQLRIRYKTTYSYGVELRNKASLTGSFPYTETRVAPFRSAASAGEADGIGMGRIRIVKTDKDTGNPVEGAKFQVTNGTAEGTFTVISGDTGIIITRYLDPGQWQVTEIEAPKGYVIDNTIHTLQVNAGEPTELSVVNNRETISIPVEKRWIGTVANQATVSLYGDGVLIEKVQLTEDKGWNHTFTNLNKYDLVNNRDIVYTIVEDQIIGYTSVVTGDSLTGFTITNTENPKEETPSEPTDPTANEPNQDQTPGQPGQEDPGKVNKTTPKTGDSSNLIFPLLILTVGGVAFIALKRGKAN